MSAARFWDLLVIYLCIGGAIGALSFAITQKALRDHPFQHAMSPQKMLAEAIIWHMLTWPWLVFLWSIAGLFKVVGFFSPRPPRSPQPDENDSGTDGK
jgi:hypothetical protein